MPTQLTHINLLIVEPNPLLQIELGNIVKQQYPDAIVVPTKSIAEATKKLTEQSFDLAILESDIENYDGFQLINKIVTSQPNCKVLCYSNGNCKLAPSLSQEFGAKGFISKHSTANEIMSAVNCLLAGFMLFKPDDLQDMRKLSKREKLVFLYLSKGLTNKQISAKLFLSEKTISTYKVRLLKKFNSQSFVALMNYKQAVLTA
ncbi:response regulator transcription factor [Shewanella sp. Isolate11]|uniref:response regulator transcription factor n=1 Tax=Shewanella sp. Isolate11 TaxID=2908530 RepID=UPI001EFDEAF6|nr:response regulator transcription factor [Shewanella sp. Isolate11]MCG9696093.1 response regulator transcription factor [Shewanella sp. Isolate11]